MAICDSSTPTRIAPKPKPVLLEDFDDALADAQTVRDIIGHLAMAEVGGHNKIDASLFDWLALELGKRLNRIEEAGNQLIRGTPLGRSV